MSLPTERPIFSESSNPRCHLILVSPMLISVDESQGMRTIVRKFYISAVPLSSFFAIAVNPSNSVLYCYLGMVPFLSIETQWIKRNFMVNLLSLNSLHKH